MREYCIIYLWPTVGGGGGLEGSVDKRRDCNKLHILANKSIHMGMKILSGNLFRCSDSLYFVHISMNILNYAKATLKSYVKFQVVYSRIGAYVTHKYRECAEFFNG